MAEKSISDTLLSLGLPGVIILVLGYAVWNLYRRLDTVHAERLVDAKTVEGKVVDALNRNTAVLEKVVEKQEDLHEVVTKRKR